LGFDTQKAYNILTSFPSGNYNVTYYKNPPSATINGAAYIQKATQTPFSWNGHDYQLFWTVNYQNALWATNGIPVPFVGTNISMQFQIPETSVMTNATTMTFTIADCPLVQGDWVFANEFLVDGNPATSLNFQTGFVSEPVTVTAGVSTVVVIFPYAVLAAGTYSAGILQYLTNNSDPTTDCLRWYDGDPTNGTYGWVNFCPPISADIYPIADQPDGQYYLIGARIIAPFKDRLLFFGPVIQTSSPNSQVYLQDTVIYSQNGTAFYTASFSPPYPISARTVFMPLLTPGSMAASNNEIATADAYWADVTGLGGYVTAGYEQPIVTISPNEDVFIVGFSSRQTRLIYSGDGIVPFTFYVINSELGSGSTFSAVNLDRGVLTSGEHGFVQTSQIGSQRFDLQIPDALFRFSLLNNGTQRICAQRDFVNEWVYFTYPSNNNNYSNTNANIFPNQTLQYNYREDTWAVFNESYTSYGQFRQSTGNTWATIGEKFATWADWNEPWSAGATTLLQPKVIGGNAQGFVILRDEGTNESNSIYIDNISFSSAITGATNANPVVITTANNLVAGQQIMIFGVMGMTQLNGNIYTILATTPTTISIDVDGTLFGAFISGGTVLPLTTVYSPDHGLTDGDYITINSVLGTVSTEVNGKIFSVFNCNTDGFNINPSISPGTYLGNGYIQRMYVPLIQTKQFNPSWGLSRKSRLGIQMYLLTKTSLGQITLLIYLSQNAIGLKNNAYNNGPIVPSAESQNNTLIYNTTLYTCPESGNLGLTPPNTNLQMVTANAQEQIWHRINTSLIGDTVQLGFTMSDAQMRDPSFNNQFSEIELHSFIIDVTPSQYLA
jgi:hypothetical protein